jgi:hypothetical protein
LAADAAGVALAAGVEQGRHVLQWQARGDGHAVPALLAGDLQVRQAGGDEGLAWKLGLLALDLLQAQHVGPLLVDEAGDLLGAQADGVDVPGGDTEAHGWL